MRYNKSTCTIFNKFITCFQTKLYLKYLISNLFFFITFFSFSQTTENVKKHSIGLSISVVEITKCSFPEYTIIRNEQSLDYNTSLTFFNTKGFTYQYASSNILKIQSGIYLSNEKN